jgi:2-oxoglutarate ferredoxin oxidoreductase subunit gamma
MSFLENFEMAEEITGIRLSGLGGQGVVLAGLILGAAAVHEGLYAAGSSAYGAQSRGSVCKAEVVISRARIDYPHVEQADVLVAMSQEGYDAYANQVAETGKIYYDTSLVPSHRSCRQDRAFDVTATCIKELNEQQVANIVWVGILARALGWFGERSLEQAIREHIPARHVDLNLRALRLGLTNDELRMTN